MSLAAWIAPFNPTLVQFKHSSCVRLHDKFQAFNPTLVQFKQCKRLQYIIILITFNPTLVQFKQDRRSVHHEVLFQLSILPQSNSNRSDAVFDSQILTSFNPTLVQFKHNLIKRPVFTGMSFNPTLVQFKLEIRDETNTLIFGFQSYLSPIQTVQ